MEAIPSGLRVRSLASGSDGNCILIQAGDAALLIDAGISARRIVTGLRDAGLHENALRAVLVTHEHSDHSRGLRVLTRRVPATVIANRQTLARLEDLAPAPGTAVLPTGDGIEIAGIRVRSFPVSHDASDPVGYVIEWNGQRVGYATDTGVAGEEVRAHLRGVGLAIIESNHDVDRLMGGPYPAFLKRRILGESGHLSNEHAGELAADLLRHHRATELWLAHLSAVNNTPALAETAVRRSLNAAGFAGARLCVLPRGCPGPLWSAGGQAVQLTLF